MSFFKQLFPEERIVAPEASQKLRGLKGFSPEHVAALRDPFYAEDPVFWSLGAELGPAAGFLGKVGVEVPADRNIVVIVDGYEVDSDVADSWQLWTVQGSDAVRAALTTDLSVFTMNRRQQNAVSGIPERCGLLRIVDNFNATTGQSLGTAGRTAAGIPWLQPVFGLRLFQAEQFWIANGTANIRIECRMWGRLAARRG